MAGAESLQKVRAALVSAVDEAVYRMTPTSKTQYNFEVVNITTSHERVNLEELKNIRCH